MWPQFFPNSSHGKWVVTITLQVQHIVCQCLPENEVCHGVSLCSCTFNTFCNTVASLAPLCHQEQKCWHVKMKGSNKIWTGFRTHHRVKTVRCWYWLSVICPSIGGGYCCKRSDCPRRVRVNSNVAHVCVQGIFLILIFRCSVNFAGIWILSKSSTYETFFST